MAEAVFQLGQKALIINEHDEALMVSCRSTRDPKIILHDFPGGRVDLDEHNLHDSLQRELQEELGIQAEVHDLLAATIAPHHITSRPRVLLLVYHCSIKSGQIMPNNEIIGYEWVPIDMVHKMPHARYSKEVIAKIKTKLAI